MSARTVLVDHLTAALPDTWDVLPFSRDLANLTKPTVTVSTSRFEQGPAGGLWACTCAVTVVAPFEDYATAEDWLEDGVVTALNALETLPHLNLGADRVVVADKHHAYQINVTLPLAKTSDEPEE